MLEFLVRGGNVGDRHPLSDLAPEMERGELLVLDELPPTEAGVPADRLVHERR